MDTPRFLQAIKSEVIAATPRVLALRNQRKEKEDSSFVTEGDLLINELIARIAKEAKADIQIVSEESAHQQEPAPASFVVVVDPIDGTENFTSGLPEWGISVSCYDSGKHIGSLLGCPEMNLWLQTGDTMPNFFSRIRGLSSSLQKEELIKATEGHEYRMLGCCVYNMINVIRGSFLSFENPKGAHSWDILGGINLALEHQLTVIVNDKEYSGEYLPAGGKYRFWVGR